MLYIALAGSLLMSAFTSYWGARAWRSSPEAWRAMNEQNRPVSWRRWPVYSVIWRDFDRHPSCYLWLARLVLPIGAAISAAASLGAGSRLLGLI